MKSEFRAHKNVDNPIHIVSPDVFAACGTSRAFRDIEKLTGNSLVPDWLLVGMANICAETRGRQLGR